MQIDERPLHGVQRAIRRTQVFDRQKLAPMQRRDELDARVHGAVPQPALSVRLRENHGAGAAVALRAPFLRAHPPLVAAQVLKHRERGGYVVKRPLLVAQHEPDRVSHQLPRYVE
jgi:hypothetical protein